MVWQSNSTITMIQVEVTKKSINKRITNVILCTTTTWIYFGYHGNLELY
jgi:hypothetical protein